MPGAPCRAAREIRARHGGYGNGDHVDSIPAITSAIIGPRTCEHLGEALDTGRGTLGHDVLDRIDEIVPPGTTLDDGDAGHVPPALADAALRRRTPVSR